MIDAIIIITLIFFAGFIGLVELVDRVGGLDDEITVKRVTEED